MHSTSHIGFFGGTESVTGANFLFDTGGKKILIDCGMQQGSHDAEAVNFADFPYDPSSIDVLIVTHAHADHMGRIPKLVKDGFKGDIYSTPVTRDLTEVMFEDAVKIVASDAQKHGHEPLYTEDHANAALALWRTHEYHESFLLGDDVSVAFYDAGHILGSAMALFERGGVKFLATGDLGNSPAPLLCDTEIITDANYMLIESVYGDRVHEERNERTALLRDILIDTYKHGRTLLIPSFAMQRTQILLYEINKMVESGEVPVMPVYLDSPLGSKVTDIYKKYTHLYNERIKKEIAAGDDIFDFPAFTIVRGARESHEVLNAKAPKVIIASSGMSVGGRVLTHEKRLLGDKNTTILFVGYQGAGTLGRRIQDGNSTVTINKKKVRVRAKVATIRGFSAHKDREGLLEVVDHSSDTLKEVFVAMGEPKSSLFLVQRIRDFLGIDARAPQQGEVVTIDF